MKPHPHSWHSTISKHLCMKVTSNDIHSGAHNYDRKTGYSWELVYEGLVAAVGRGPTMNEAIRDGLQQLALWTFEDTLAFAAEQARRTSLTAAWWVDNHG